MSQPETKRAEPSARRPLAQAVGKTPPNGNPLVAHRFGADPYALVHGGRVYLYMTNDILERDEQGNAKDNTYGRIDRIGILSSDDLVNWTDHGEVHVAGKDGAAVWATQSWAPAAACKLIGGKERFFLYFANNASGIGVLEGDSPTGPWTDPLGEALIARSTPGVEDVTWLFDPAVLVEEDGSAYIYFGGGIPEGRAQWPDTARVMKLGDDMTSVVGTAQPIRAPYLFEDAGINKRGGVYYFSYCSNFHPGEREEGSPPAGEIAYMTSGSPTGPWTYERSILRNPSAFFGVGGNNHHAMFEFAGSWYMAYHAQTLSKAMGVPLGYRSTHLNRVEFDENGAIREIQADLAGVPAVKALNPYVRTSGSTSAWTAGVSIGPAPRLAGARAAAASEDGGWIGLAGADFGAGASAFAATVRSDGAAGTIELRLDQPDGALIGRLEVPAEEEGEGEWRVRSTAVAGADGVHDLYLVFRGEPDAPLLRLLDWQFSE